MARCAKNLGRGFTLVELLVVISIIAILLSMLMPAMQRAKKQARAIMCRSNLKQWGLVFSLYTSQNNGYFCEGFWAGHTDKSSMWQEVFRPFYSNQGKLRVCPEAITPMNPTADPTKPWWGSTTKAWGVFGEKWWEGWTTEGDYGSYGINGWVYNPPETDKTHWRTVNVTGVSNVPIFLDSIWVATFPGETDRPPQIEDDIVYSTPGWMSYHCIDRHSGYINSVMLDCSVQRIGLKQLWKLKWHRQFNVNARRFWTWPEWMKKFKDYN